MNLKLILLIVFFGSLTKAETEVHSEPKSGKVEFAAVGRPDMLIITGSGDEISSKFSIDGTKLSGEVSFLLSSLKTGIELRDEDMKEKYLQIKKYPETKIIFNDFQMPVGWTIQNAKVVNSSFRGKLYLHGVELEITGLYSIDPKELKTTAKFDIKLSDFKIATPVYLGIKVADFVKVTVTIDKMLIAK